jgi:hypothetical protein
LPAKALVLTVFVVLGLIVPERAFAGSSGGASGNQGSITSWAVGTGNGGIATPTGTTCGPWTPGADIKPEPGPPDIGGVRQGADGVVWTLYFRDCEGQRQWTWIPNLSPQQLAPLARDQVTRLLPKPSATFSPDFLHRTVNPFTLVRIPTLFAVPAAQWAPVSAQAQIPGLTVTATATPARLVFTPGEPDGNTVMCVGPGVVVRSADEFPANPPPCSYEYKHASSIVGGEFAATLTIEWDITWTSSTGAGGTLAPASTTVGVAVPVREVQAIVAGGS